MAEPTYDELVTGTLKFRANDIKDSVTNNMALFLRLKEKGNYKSTPGGTEILEPILYGSSPNVGWISGFDPIPIAASQVLSASKWNWKLMADALAIDGTTMRINSGPQQKIEIVGQKVDALKATLKNTWNAALYSDGTGNGGKEIVGLGAMLSATQTSGTYGGIDRALWTWWRAGVTTTSTTSTNIRNKMATVIVGRRRGNDRIDLIAAGDTKYIELVDALQGFQVFTNPKLAEAGFETVRYMGADVVPDGGIGGLATTTNMYFFNTNYIFARYHPEANFSILGSETREPVNQDALVKLYGWQGALTCSGLQFQAIGIFA